MFSRESSLGWLHLQHTPIAVAFAYWKFLLFLGLNRPFVSSPQNEIKCAAFNMKMIFHSHANKTHS